jgi:uroporphyrinogen III methyltransferase/synthase
MKVLITRPRSQADDFAGRLRGAGFEPVFFPVIEIRPIEHNAELDQALEKLSCYAWVVFTSINAVDVVFGRLPAPPSTLPLKSSGAEGGVSVAAIGPKTAQGLEAHGVIPDFVPQEYVAEAIVPGLGDIRGKWILLPRAEIARKALPEAIVAAGGTPHEIAVYETLPAQPDLGGLAALKSGVDVITLTSPSTVQNFVAIAKQNGLDPLNLPNHPLFACIGPITERAAKEEGLVNLVVAKEFTTEGLMKQITKQVHR